MASTVVQRVHMGFYLNLLSCSAYLLELLGSCGRVKFRGNNAFFLGERSIGQKIVNSSTGSLIGDLWGHFEASGHCLLYWVNQELAVLACGKQLGCAITNNTLRSKCRRVAGCEL